MLSKKYQRIISASIALLENSRRLEKCGFEDEMWVDFQVEEKEIKELLDALKNANFKVNPHWKVKM